MTTTEASTPVPLWDDERIEGVLMWVKYRGLTAGTREMLKIMRDEYEAKLNEYQGVYLHYIEQAEKVMVLEAEAQRLREGGQWTPVSVGTFSTDNATLAIDDNELSIITDKGDDVGVVSWILPGNYRVCKRITTTEATP
jgi:hypothetical protein